MLYLCRIKIIYMIEQPPKVDIAEAMGLIARPEVAEFAKEINAKYLYWSDLKYKVRLSGVSAEQLWGAVKISRRLLYIFNWGKYGISVPMTNEMQRMCHFFDMNFGGSWGSGSLIPNEDRERFLVSSLMEEAISSSQMEGAATTRKVAKDMLRKKISPRSRSEQMIYNNYASIKYITEHKDEDLTPGLLLHLHSLMTNKTLECSDDEGRFRNNDDVVVENSITHEVVHTPPSHTDIPAFVEELCRFANTDDDKQFIHPILKAIVIHFMVSYVHPFVDGNGRTARSLFYWYMLKKGYWLTEYLSISRVIYRSKASYEKSFLYTEADGCDMGYFIAYHLRVLDLAFKELQNYIQTKTAQRQNHTELLRIFGINERQAALVALFRDNPKAILTIKEVETRFAVSQPTARLDVEGLVNIGLVEKIKVNKVRANYIRANDFEETLKKLLKT